MLWNQSYLKCEGPSYLQLIKHNSKRLTALNHLTTLADEKGYVLASTSKACLTKLLTQSNLFELFADISIFFSLLIFGNVL